MREYNLFVLKDSCKKVFKEEQSILFNNLKDIYLSDNIIYGKYLFEQMCEYIDVDILKEYFNKKYNIKYGECFKYGSCQIYVKHSRIVVKSIDNLPNILKIFNIYNRNIFICDFFNNDYFFLNDLKGKFLQKN